MTDTLIVDPPDGHRYGYPKAVPDDRRHDIKHADIGWNGGKGEQTHDDLHPSEKFKGVADAVNARTDPKTAACEAQNKRRKHELERVGRSTKHQHEHSDPADLVDE